MTQIAAMFRRVITLLVELATAGPVATYNVLRPVAGLYVRSLAIVSGIILVVVPILVGVKMYSGNNAYAYAAIIIAAICTLILGLLWSPISLFIGLVITGNVGLSREKLLKFGERYVKKVGGALFGELIASICIILIPFHNNTGLLPLWILALVTFVLGSILWGGWMSGRKLTRLTLLSLGVLTLCVMLPETHHVAKRKGAGLDHKIAQSLNPSTSTVKSGDGYSWTENVTPGIWREVVIPPRPFSWESSCDIQFKLADGRIVNAPKDQWVKLGLIPGPLGMPKKIWVQGTASTGQVVFRTNK